MTSAGACTAESVRRLARVPGVTGLKDGHSDLDRLQRTVLAARDRVPGYAVSPVSPVKAAARLRGWPVGPVRAPLTGPSPADLAALRTLLTTGLDLVGAAL